jgi:Signal peptide binding domain
VSRLRRAMLGSGCKRSEVGMAQDFTLDDFRRQLDQIQIMGMKNLLGHMPGLAEMVSDEKDPELAFSRIRKMIDAMTDEERSNPDLIDSRRRSRIATSSSTHPQEVEQFLAQFHQARVDAPHGKHEPLGADQAGPWFRDVPRAGGGAEIGADAIRRIFIPCNT